MCVLAHPDDESLGTGGTLAKYAAEGVETYLVTATRGERGRFGDGGERPAAGGRRTDARGGASGGGEGARRARGQLLGYPDGALDTRGSGGGAGGDRRRICAACRPHVVMTFGPEGAYGHPDHIAISQLTTAAIVRAAERGVTPSSKLYYIAWSAKTWAAYQARSRS